MSNRLNEWQRLKGAIDDFEGITSEFDKIHEKVNSAYSLIEVGMRALTEAKNILDELSDSTYKLDMQASRVFLAAEAACDDQNSDITEALKRFDTYMKVVEDLEQIEV